MDIIYDDNSIGLAEDTAFTVIETGNNQQDDLAVGDLVDSFLDENPIDAETIAQIDQELLESELNSGSDDTDTLVDQTSHEESAIDDVHEADIDLEVEVELVEYGINDMVDGGSIDTYSMEGV